MSTFAPPTTDSAVTLVVDGRPVAVDLAGVCAECAAETPAALRVWVHRGEVRVRRITPRWVTRC